MLSSDHNAGFFKSFANCREPERAGRLAVNFRNLFGQTRCDGRMQFRGGGHISVACLYSPSGENKVPRHEGVPFMALSEQHLRLASRTIDQDQTGRVTRLRIGIGQAVGTLSDSCKIFHSMPSKTLVYGLWPKTSLN